MSVVTTGLGRDQRTDAMRGVASQGKANPTYWSTTTRADLAHSQNLVIVLTLSVSSPKKRTINRKNRLAARRLGLGRYAEE